MNKHIKVVKAYLSNAKSATEFALKSNAAEAKAACLAKGEDASYSAIFATKAADAAYAAIYAHANSYAYAHDEFSLAAYWVRQYEALRK